MTIGQIIGLVIVVALAIVGGIIISRKSKKYTLLKWVSLFVLLAIALTWVFSAGLYQGATFSEYGRLEQGLTDLPNILYQAIYLAGDKIVFLLTLGAFYAILSKNNGYKKIVTSIASKFKGKEILFVLITSFVITGLTAFFNQTFAILVFVPFIISIINNMKLDKISAFNATFGSMIVGTLGMLTGGEGHEWLNYYMGTENTAMILARVVVLVLGFLGYNLFSVLHAKKVLKNNALEKEDPFKVESASKNARALPTVIVLVLVFVLTILGYFSWESLGVSAFGKFHEWLIGLSIGKFQIFKVILGTANAAFGTWNLLTVSAMLFIFAVIIALMGRVNLNDFIESIHDGIKKMSKPLLLFVVAYMVLITAYMCPFMPTINNLVLRTAKFNPYLVSLMAFLTNAFHLDLSYTGFALGQFLAGNYAANINVVQLIYYTTYGFVGLFVPTQALLLIGLSYLNIDYKSWFKYIWKFLLGVLVVLLIIFTILTYVG